MSTQWPTSDLDGHPRVARDGEDPRRLRREIALTRVAIGFSAGASCVAAGLIGSLMVGGIRLHHWAQGLAQLVFLVIVTFLIYGSFVYQFTRLGYLRRRATHRPARDEQLDRFFTNPDAPPLAILIPSYKEEEHVVRKTLLSAALQEYPHRRVILLIDDPPNPTTPADLKTLAVARDLPGEIERLLEQPRERWRAALEAYANRQARGRLDLAAEMDHLATLYREIAAWFQEQAERYPIIDHADELFVHVTFRALAERYRAKAQAWLDRRRRRPRRRGPGRRPSARDLLADYRRLATLFQVEVCSFERKRYANLSHEANKAMNLNSYLALMGGSFREEVVGGDRLLRPATTAERAGLRVPDAAYVLMLDADSVLFPDYAIRLIDVLEQPGGERVAVAQTPYSAFPHAPGPLERIAGATTDIQYIIHQGFTHYGATFWVGANALVRKSALEAIAEPSVERGYPIVKFIQDRTVIEDTESSVDLIDRGWRLYNYPERLAFSATPPDFGSLLIQRRRWANGGLLIVPKLLRYLIRHAAAAGGGRLREGLMRAHYLISLAGANLGLLVILAFSFDEGLRTLWLPLTALPYYALVSRDLSRAGYRATDVLRVYALNLMLIPVHLSGVVKSLHQAWTGRKTPFARTPKIQGRTTPPMRYVLLEYALLGQWLLGGLVELLHGHRLHAAFALANVAFLGYAIVTFVGLGDPRAVSRRLSSLRSRWAAPRLPGPARRDLIDRGLPVSSGE